MQLVSPEFSNSQQIPPIYTCKGNNVNPPLEISAAPAATKSLALVVIDPDAPRGNFTHWLIWNIPPTAQKIAANSRPSQASQGTNSLGAVGYTGPCPPSGTHRYIFTLYALDVVLDLPQTTTTGEFLAALEDHTLEKTQLVGTFSA